MKFVAYLVVVLAAAGCSKSKDPPGGAGSGSPAAGSAGAVSSSGVAGAGSAGSGSAGSGSAGAAAAPPPAPYTPAADVPEPLKAVIAATDRSTEDRALDAGRKPGEVLAFFRVAPGQKIGELFAGGGYSSELIARVLGDSGTLYAQNSKEVLDRFARKPWTERAQKPVMKRVVALERPIDDPFPGDVRELDAVITILNYHDTVWQKADRPKMNKAVFAALRPGGVYGIVDHSAAAGSGVRDVETLHRIDEEVVKQEVTAAGFRLDASSDALRNPADPRDWNSSPRQAGERRGTSDRFVLRFVKPAK
ncbi:MAG TPA: SAM-dependent methyltransferase [Kofleriaceae bacterium]|nr:SAM-dependent methyltransferase [Kofleriaceae bacterium]